jgi:hypothetical protein
MDHESDSLEFSLTPLYQDDFDYQIGKHKEPKQDSSTRSKSLMSSFDKFYDLEMTEEKRPYEEILKGNEAEAYTNVYSNHDHLYLQK